MQFKDKQMSILKKAEVGAEKAMFASRWILAPFFFGLIGALILLLIKFVMKLVDAGSRMFVSAGETAISTEELIVATLSMVDMALIGSLLLMIMFSGYEIFVSKIDVDHEDRPKWMGQIDFSGLKLKLIGAIVAISAIELLRAFFELDPGEDYGHLLVQIAIHVVFVISGLLFAITDKIAATTPNH